MSTKHKHSEAKTNRIKRAINVIKTFRKNHMLGKLNWKDLRDEERRY